MNFKSLREDKLKLTQEQFAEVYGLELSAVQELEKSNEPGLTLIQKIIQKTGLSFEEVTSFEKPKLKAFEAKYTWEKADFTKKSLVEYIRESLKKMDVSEEHQKKYIDDFTLGIDANLVKPSISIVGRSDTGKSTLINSLIGMEKMPTAWTPTTSIAVYIKHIKERPDFIKEDAWVFARECDGENLWNSKRLYDEEYCKKWKIAAGEVDVLRKFGTRQGGGLATNAGSAVVFIDAPILLNCDIVDLPGFGTETDSDDAITLKAAQRTDVLIYLSQANGFMRIEDIEYLKQNVRNLPIWEKKGANEVKPLANLFVVASQAHTVCQGNEIELNNILAKGCENYLKTLSTEYWNSRKSASGYDYSAEVVSERFFTYTTDIPVLCERFISELKQIIEQLPDQIDKRTKNFIHEYVDSRKPSLKAEIEKYEKLVEDRERYVLLLQQIEDSELQRVADNDKNKNTIKEKISDLRDESLSEFSTYCSSILNTDAIASKIKAKKIKNKKDEIECFASQLQDEMQEECSKLLEGKAEDLSGYIKKYINDFSENIQTVFEKSDLNVDFDAGFAFASALSKIGIIGGLGAYVAGEAAFLLCGWTFLLGIGGHIALGASAFGPIGVAVGLAIAAALRIAKLFGGGWEKSVAKKLAKAYDENNVVEKYRTEIKAYWEKTESAFDKATVKLEEEWDNYVSNLRSTVNEYDIDKINDNIVALQNLQSFFENIPLS